MTVEQIEQARIDTFVRTATEIVLTGDDIAIDPMNSYFIHELTAAMLDLSDRIAQERREAAKTTEVSFS